MPPTYYRDARGREPVVDYLAQLRRSGEKRIISAVLRQIALLDTLGADPGMPVSRIIDRRNRIYELRPGDHRIAYAEYGGTIVLLHAWRKRTQELDRIEAARALRNLERLIGG